ncbi:MAG: alanine racemase [Actinobacteria bacterium]|nr:alanine racemase [Actinomycetota bacterium]MCA1720963.1 alanine racemase [Actinomycetota bacterium]
MDLTAVLGSTVDETVKGMPGGMAAVSLADVGAQGWNVSAGDLPLPLLVARRTALTHNLELMARYCDESGALLAPHGKTTMSPQLFAEQLTHGAWGITAASVQQIQVYRAAGVPRIVLANEVADPAGLRYLTQELARDPAFDFYCWVDSVAGVEALATAAREHGLERPFQVLVEIGWPGGRTGARDDAAVDAVVAAIAAHPGLVSLVGVSVFEGLLGLDRVAPGVAGGAAQGPDVHEFLARAAATAQRLRDDGALPDGYLLSGGGSTAFDAVVAAFGAVAGARLLLRSGCYVTHDHGMNAALSPLSASNDTPARDRLGALRPALELWCTVNSTPEAGLAMLACGRRDAPYDAGLPVPLWGIAAATGERLDLSGAEVVGLNDQHGYLRTGAQQLAVGDRVVLGISHPCTAFDKWQVIPVVDDDDNVIDAIRTYF